MFGTLLEFISKPFTWILIGSSIVLVAGFISNIQQSKHEELVAKRLEDALVNVDRVIGYTTWEGSVPEIFFDGSSNLELKHYSGVLSGR